MSSQTPLQRGQRYLEEEAHCERYSHHVRDRLRRIILTCDDEDDRSKLLTEDKVLTAAIYLEDDTDRVGSVAEIALTKDEVAYVRSRLAETKSAYLKLRYASAIWTHGPKHNDLGKAMVDACFSLLEMYRKFDAKEPDGHWGLRYRRVLKVLFRAGRKFRWREAEAREIVLWALASYPKKSTSRFVVRIDAAELLLEGRVGTEAYLRIRRIALAWGLQQVREGNEFQAIHHTYRVGRSADAKLEKDLKIWDRRIAEAYEHMARGRMDEPAVAAGFLWAAAEHFKKAGKVEDAERLRREHSVLKTKRNYAEFKTQQDITAFVEQTREVLAKS